MTDYCMGCGNVLPDDLALRSVSHTIKPGKAVLCSKCGVKESTDPLWTYGARMGALRAEAAINAPKVKSRHEK